MAESFTKQTLKVVVSQLCQTIGWNSINLSCLELLVDVLHRYLDEVGRTTHLYADQFGRTRPNLDDLGLAFTEMGIDVRELEEYVQFVDSVPCTLQVPQYPVRKESHLNFLKPGSKEVVTRPVHVHEHLPPTLLPEDTPLHVDTSPTPAHSSPQRSPASTSPVFKRPGDPIESPALKRARLVLEEEGRPLREISSVIMTTGGLLSPAREGKLPESKVVLPAADRSISPTPFYPSVPPEVNRKKPKAETTKPKKKSEDAIKKLASVKETEKLKALKSKRPRVKIEPEKSLIQKLSESPHLVVTPVVSQPSVRRQSPPLVRDSGVTIAKLNAEPETQKLNIFKRIAKVPKEEKIEKPEKVDKIEKIDFGEVVQQSSRERERSPGLIIEEVKKKEVKREKVMEKEVKREKVMEKEREVNVEVSRPRTPDIAHVYDDELSSPGSPSTPKTPEMMRRERERSPEQHRKRKRDRDKKKKKEKMKTEEDSIERPKTPEMLEAREPRREQLPTPVFPFYPHFPPGPGLIPPPIANPLIPLIPRFPLPLGPNFPNLPLPPPLMQLPLAQQQLAAREEPRREREKEKHEKQPTAILSNLTPTFNQQPSGSREKGEKEVKSPLAILLNKSDRKIKDKEHRKNKDKIKKKKDKKDKMKKLEKKHREEGKHKSKERKEKKEKKLKSPKEVEVSVPKLTLKLGPASPRPPSPKRLVVKPLTRDDGSSPRREPSPEIARISALFNKPPSGASHVTHAPHASHTPHTKPLMVVTEQTAPVVSALKSPGTIIDKDGNKVWICPACGRPDDGSAMIGCDECDAWYHWVCVGIQVPPDKNEDWYCRFCIVKKQGGQEKKKRGRKKKPPV